MTTAEVQCQAAHILWLLDNGYEMCARAALHALADDRRVQSVPEMLREE